MGNNTENHRETIVKVRDPGTLSPERVVSIKSVLSGILTRNSDREIKIRQKEYRSYRGWRTQIF